MDLMFWFVLISILIFGLIAGSFANCAIFRFGEGESALDGRSRCPKCRRELAWYDLIPVVSFFILRGKCRHCQKPISWQYPAVELAVAGLFCAAAWRFYPAVFAGHFSFFPLFELSAWWIFLAAMAVVFSADWRWYLIPDGALIAGLIAVLALRAGALAQDCFLFGRIDFAALADPFSGAAFAGGLFLAMFLASRGKWMGFGDVKLAFLMGLALGFWPVLLAVFLANLFGAIMGLVMVSAKKKKMSSPIPFGPFLVAGLLVSLFFAPAILDWYLFAG